MSYRPVTPDSGSEYDNGANELEPILDEDDPQVRAARHFQVGNLGKIRLLLLTA